MRITNQNAVLANPALRASIFRIGVAKVLDRFPPKQVLSGNAPIDFFSERLVGNLLLGINKPIDPPPDLIVLFLMETLEQFAKKTPWRQDYDN